MIDFDTYYFNPEDKILFARLTSVIHEIIESRGLEKIYIGKTSNPQKRMTGENMAQNESFSEIGIINEDKEHIPPHDKPHIENGYTKMYILTSFDNKAGADKTEKGLIEQFWTSIRNKSKGGEGADGGSPYYLYVAVQESEFS